MIARNAFSQLHHSDWLLAGTVAGMCVLYLAPPLLLLSGTRLSTAFGAAAWLTMTVAYWPHAEIGLGRLPSFLRLSAELLQSNMACAFSGMQLCGSDPRISE
jgi:hypothetical protein